MLKMKSRATFVKVAEITKMLAFLTIYNIWKKGWNLEFNCNSMGKRGKEGKKGREGGKGDSHSCSSSGEILYKRLYFWLYFWSIQWKAAEFHQRGVKPPTLPPSDSFRLHCWALLFPGLKRLNSAWAVVSTSFWSKGILSHFWSE